MSHRISQSQYQPRNSGARRDGQGPGVAPEKKTEVPPAAQPQKQGVDPDAPDAGEDPAVAGRDRLQGNENRPMGPGVPSSGEA